MHEIILILSTAIASSGFWGIIQYIIEKRSSLSGALVGVMHYQILQLANKYINRGWVHQNEYDDLLMYLYKPYKELGGNGTVDNVMEKVSRLPFECEG